MKTRTVLVVGIVLIQAAVVCGDVAPSSSTAWDQRFLPPPDPIPAVRGIAGPTDPAEGQSPEEGEEAENLPVPDRPKQDTEKSEMVAQAPSGRNATHETPAAILSGALQAEEPNREGVIYLGGDTEVTPGSINPFDFRVRSIEQAKQVKLRVGGTFGGKRPAALMPRGSAATAW